MAFNNLSEALERVSIDNDARFGDNNALRNKALNIVQAEEERRFKKGTTIVGIVFKDGVILGADSRATAGNIVADKYCVKLHRITNKIYACGAGTAADLDQVARMVEGNMTLLELKMNHDAQVLNAVAMAKKHLFRYQGHIGAYLIIGGIDINGAHVFTVHAGGSSQRHSFVADGSGSLAAMSILEREFKLDMQQDEALQLVKKALEAGMHSDLASGNTLTYAVITKEGTQIERLVEPDFCRVEQPKKIYNDKLADKFILKTAKNVYNVEKMDSLRVKSHC